MKSSAEQSSTTTSATATQSAHQPFFAKADGGTFFEPVAGGAVPAFQMKMRVNQPGDKFEQEADKMADKVMRMPTPASTMKEEQLQRQADDRLQKKDEDKIQKAATPEEKLQKKDDDKVQKAQASDDKLQRKGDGVPAVGASTQSAIQNKTTGGQPLSSGVRAYMEPRFNADFSNVRVHSDPESASLSNQLSARAFTHQNHVFFSRDQYQPGTSEGKQLLAHELTHTVQQGHAVQRSPQISTTVTPPPVQRLGIQDALDYFADKASNIPGYMMLTVLLGFNPISMRSVSRTAANLLRALIELIPGGHLITQVLDNHGVINKAAAWVEQKIAILGDIGGDIVAGLKRFIDDLSWTDIFHLGRVWDRAKRIFTDPIGRLINFGVSVAVEILKMVKDVILKPLAVLAKDTRGYDLLKTILGEDPITGEPVPRTAENLLGGFMKFIGQEEIWENIKKGKAIPRAWAWFQGALEGLMGLVRAVPRKIVNTLTSLTFTDIITVVGAFSKVVGAFVSIAVDFIKWGLGTIWNLLEIIFDVVKPGIMVYIKKTGTALKSIIKNPLPFVGNLVRAAKLGFQNFADNFWEHLKAGLIDWLTGSLEGVYIPKALSLPEMGKFAMSVLGISWAQIRGKIVKVLGPNGETIMKGLETGFDIVVALVTGGPAAAWELIKEKLNDLKDQVVSGIIGFVTDTVIKKAVPKLIAMFIPGAGFISAIISIYDTIMVFVEKISKIIQVVVAFIDSIVAIAGGNITAAAKRVENILGGLLSLAISFLAGFLGLGKVTDKIKEVIEKVRASVDKAIDAAIAWIVDKAKKLFAKLFGKDKKDERTPEQKQADLDKAMDEAEILRSKTGITEAEIIEGLKPIKNKYKMVSLALVVDAQSEADETVHIEGEINPKEKSPQKKINSMSAKNIASESPIYASPDSDLGGVEMTANFLTPMHPKGSGVSVKPPIMDKIPKTRGGTRLYVQGHLLNRLLGGPGNTIENLTPLTYEANGDHERNAESEVKSLVNDKNKAVKYVVKVHYPSRSKTDAPNTAEGRLATKLTASWHTWDILSVNPLEKQKGSIGKENVPIKNVPPWPHT